MAKNISLLGADYPGVPAVQLPQTGGGTATFYDISDVLITEEKQNNQITWNSASDPYEENYVSIAKQGYTPIGIVGYNITGTGSTYCFLSRLIFTSSYLFYTARRTNTPGSLTENKLNFTVLYKKSS